MRYRVTATDEGYIVEDMASPHKGTKAAGPYRTKGQAHEAMTVLNSGGTI